MGIGNKVPANRNLAGDMFVDIQEVIKFRHYLPNI
jgi:hypothetical protein